MKKKLFILFSAIFMMMVCYTGICASAAEATGILEIPKTEEFLQAYEDEKGNIHFPTFEDHKTFPIFIDESYNPEDPLDFRIETQQRAMEETIAKRMVEEMWEVKSPSEQILALLKKGAKVNAELEKNEFSNKHEVHFKVYLESKEDEESSSKDGCPYEDACLSRMIINDQTFWYSPTSISWIVQLPF